MPGKVEFLRDLRREVVDVMSNGGSKPGMKVTGRGKTAGCAVRFEHENALPGPGKQGCANQSVMAGADDDRIVVLQRAWFLFCSRKPLYTLLCSVSSSFRAYTQLAPGSTTQGILGA